MTTILRGHLKAAIIQRLEEVSVEHPAGHQGKLAVRFLLRSEKGESIELMFEKGAATPANLWVLRGFAEQLMSSGIERRESMSGTLHAVTNSMGKKIYGRHAALLAMRQLANADLVCFKLKELGELEAILEILRHQGDRVTSDLENSPADSSENPLGTRLDSLTKNRPFQSLRKPDRIAARLPMLGERHRREGRRSAEFRHLIDRVSDVGQGGPPARGTNFDALRRRWIALAGRLERVDVNLTYGSDDKEQVEITTRTLVSCDPEATVDAGWRFRWKCFRCRGIVDMDQTDFGV